MKRLLICLLLVVSFAYGSPFREGYLDVGDGHEIYFAEFGNPEGQPILVLHGGPAFGCFPSWTRWFDLEFYRVIMFDQRGAKRSRPFAEMRDNTPQKHVADIEKLREFLQVDQWILFGGSWGSTLSLLYGETHPDRVSGFILRGVFLGREEDYNHLFFGMRAHYPEAWDEMVETLGITDSSTLIETLYEKLMDPDPSVHLLAAHAFMRFDTICGSVLPDQKAVEEVARDDGQALNVARTFTHYSVHKFFLEEGQIMRDLGKIAHIPAIIVQGRHDHITPPIGAYLLHKGWPGSKLWIIPDAGHFASEFGSALKDATDTFRSL
jgi:proline iminopeptidase